MSFVAELKRRNVIRMAGLYLVGAWLVTQVASTVFPAFDLPAWTLRGVILLLAIGFIPALIVSWVFELTPDGLKRDAEVPPGASIAPQTARRMDRAIIMALALALLVMGFDRFLLAPRRDAAPVARTSAQPAPDAPVAAKRDPRSIAVLPFVNMSADAENEFFSDGLSEEILNSLARIEGMQVVGRTSSFQFKGKNQDLREVGEKLGVASVLEGSVRREGERARITAQLIRASDGIHLWSETYDRTLQDSFAVQLDIAEKVAGALNIVLDDRQRETMRKSGVKNVDAFIAYQKGVKLVADAHAKPDIDLFVGLRAANEEFEKATTLEPGFFEPHFAKADLQEHLLQDDKLGAAERLAAQQAALKTLELAAANSKSEQQRLLTLAERQMLSDDWKGLSALIDASLKAPGCNASNWMPVFASAFGFGDALEDMGARASACDPLNQINFNTRISVALAVGNAKRALDILDALARLGKSYAGGQTAGSIALAMSGRSEEAAQNLENVSSVARPDNYYATRVVVGRALGQDPAAIHASLKGLDRSRSKFNQWLVAELIEAANAGNRAEANRLAAAMDARASGAFLLAVMSTSCYCGAPFDLEATPNFKARLAESGLHWPPPATIAYPAIGTAKP